MIPPPDWPNRDKGRHIRAARHDWWVMADGPAADTAPTILLLHGAGGSGHSFRNILPHLAPHFRCITPDLPGQGFTRAGTRRFGLDPMAVDLAALCAHQGWQPHAIIGHSAGAAIALRLAEMIPLKAVVGINAALGTFDGLAGTLFPMLARGFAMIPFLPAAISRLWGNPARVNGLLDGTGSTLDAAGRAQYLRLVQMPSHIDGSLGMMSQWNLTPLIARLSQLATPTLLLTGSRDTTVPPRVSRDAAARMPAARVIDLPSLGHLAHEEDAATVTAALLPWLQTRITPAS